MPFVYSTPTTATLSLFEGATDKNYLTIPGVGNIEQEHRTVRYGSRDLPYDSPPQPVVADANGDGTTEVNYVGQLDDGTGYGKGPVVETTYDGVAGDWDIQQQQVTLPSDNTFADIWSWVLAPPTVQVEPFDELELHTAATGFWGMTSPCIDIWKDARWATAQQCVALNPDNTPAAGYDSNFASVFAAQVVPQSLGVTGTTGNPQKVYFQSVVPTALNTCLSATGDSTRLALPDCHSDDPKQQFVIIDTDSNGNRRADGAVKIQSVGASNNAGRPICIATRTDANGVDAYADCGSDGISLWWQLKVLDTVS